MTDKPKLTLNPPSLKLNTGSKSSGTMKGFKQDTKNKDDKENLIGINYTSSNKGLNNEPVKASNRILQVEMLTPEEYSEILKYLQKNYPKCFPAETTPLPLAVGIHKQLFASERLPFAKVKIKRFLKRYTRNKEYRRNLIVGNSRVDLQGNHSGAITEEEVNRDQWREVKLEKRKKTNHDSLNKRNPRRKQRGILEES